MVGKPAVQVVIAGDTKGLEKSLKSSSSALGSFGKTAAGVFGGLAIAKGVGLAVDGIQALGNFALGGVDKLDALGDSMARLDGLAKGLGKTATKADLTKYGVDKTEQAAGALAIAKTGKALGLTAKEVKGMTPELALMGAQLASLGDGDPEKQAALLAKALGGSTKAAKELGVALPAGVGPMKAYRILTEQLAPKLEKATSGTASLADVGDRWDATMGNLQLQLAGFLEKLAPVISALLDQLLPALGKLVDDVGPLVEDLFGSLAEAMTGFLESGGAQAISDIFGAIAGIFAKLASFVMENVVPAFLELAGAIAEELGPIFEKLSDVVDDLFPVLETVWGFIGDTVVPLLTQYVIPLVGDLVTLFLDLVSAISGPLNTALNGLGDLFSKLLDWIRPVLDMLGNLANLAGDVIGNIGGIIGIGQSAPAAAGRGRGAPGAVGLSAGIHITVQTGVGDPVAIGRTVARYLGAYTVRGGSVA